MKKIYALGFAVCVFLISVSAQSISPIWVSHYNGTGDNSDRFNKIVQDTEGNFIATGYTIHQGNYRDFLTVKFNANGDTIWWKTSNGRGNFDDEAISCVVDILGNVYVTGYSDGGNSQNDILTIKYNSAGLKLWEALWNSPYYMDDVPVAMALDGSGNLFITGMAEPDTIPGSNDYVTLKYSSSGSLLWQSLYSRSGVIGGKDEPSGLAVDNNGDVIVTGRSSNGSDDDIVTIKYNGSTGAQAFSALIYNSGNGTDRGTAVVTDNANNFIITGRSNNGSNDDFRTIKYNSNGVLQWSRFYNGPANQNDRPTTMAIDAAGDIFISGQSDVDNTSVTDYDFVTVKYNAAGVLQWARFEGSTSLQDDIPSDIKIDPSTGAILVTGKSDQDPDLSITDNAYMTVKYNSAGVKQWTRFHNGSRPKGSDIASSLVVTSSGDVYVAGGSENIATHKDATVVKYDANGTVLWVKDNNGEGDFSESGRRVVTDANNRAYIGGYAFREGKNRDLLIVALEANGDTICSWTYNGPKNDDDEITAITMDVSGNIYATGYTKVAGQKSNFITVKWNPVTCDTVWTRTWNYVTNQSDKAVSIVVDPAGNVYITGRSDSNPVDSLDNDDIVTIKYDTNGNLIWEQRYNGSGNGRDEPIKILLDNAGFVIVGGRMEKANDDDFVALKFDPANGNPVWANPALYNGPFSNDDRPLDMVIDSNNNIFLAGYSQTGSGNATDDAALVKFDPAGFISGVYGYDGIGLGNDQIIALSRDNNDNIIITMKTDVDPDPSKSNFNILTIKFDNQLNQLWLSPPEYNGPLNSDDVPVAMTTNAAGDVFVTAWTKNDTLNGRTNINWLTLRYNDQGLQTFVNNFDGPAGKDDEPNGLAIRGTSMWVTGFSVGTGKSQKNMSTLRFDLTVGLGDINLTQEIKAFPNPFSHKTTIDLSNLNKTGLYFRCYDLLGNLAGEEFIEENKEYEFHRKQLDNGIYIYTIHSGTDLIGKGKLIIQD